MRDAALLSLSGLKVCCMISVTAGNSRGVESDNGPVVTQSIMHKLHIQDSSMS